MFLAHRYQCNPDNRWRVTAQVVLKPNEENRLQQQYKAAYFGTTQYSEQY